MSVPDMDVIKDIPGYKVILKAVLKCQIQQLVEQLAATTEEESVLLTASVSDGTLSHLGSDSGKNFLEDHEDIKSQFLGFCLKRHHMRKQEKERQAAERLAEQSRMAAMPPQYSPRAGFTQRSPRFPSPRQQGPHPVALLRAGSPGGGPIRGGSGMRHAPYPMQRLPRRPNFDGQGQVQGRGQGPGIRPLMSSGQVIKIEPDENDDTSNDAAAPNSSQPSSPSQSKPPSGQNVKQESDKDDDARSESSSSTIPNEAADMKFSDSGPPEGLSLDSDLSNLISDSDANQSGLAKPQNPDGDTSQPGQSSSELDTNVKVKLEAVGDSEMDLEITGVELGGVSGPLGGASPWSQIGGAMGSQSDLEGGDQGYTIDVTKYPVMDLFGSSSNQGWKSEDASDIVSKQARRRALKFESTMLSSLYRLYGNSKSTKKSTKGKGKGSSSKGPSRKGKKPESVNVEGIKMEGGSHMDMWSETSTAGETFSQESTSSEGTSESLLKKETPDTSVGIPEPPVADTYTYEEAIKAAERFTAKEGMLRSLKFQCDICFRFLADRWNLEHHRRTHTGEKPYKCQLCDRAFAKKGNLKAHVLIHYRNQGKVEEPLQMTQKEHLRLPNEMQWQLPKEDQLQLPKDDI